MPGVAISPDELKQRCASITMLLLDVDGVLTDGVIGLNDRGIESRHFHVRDGIAIGLWRKAGGRSGVLSGRSAAVVSRRAAELRMRPVYQGIQDKGACFEHLLIQLELDASQVCFMGDDIVDLPVLRRAGLAACPSDAVEEVRAASHVTTEAAGGRGAVRELVELLLKQQGRWEAAIAHGVPGRADP